MNDLGIIVIAVFSCPRFDVASGVQANSLPFNILPVTHSSQRFYRRKAGLNGSMSLRGNILAKKVFIFFDTDR
jgi:hypothetical protein